MISFNDLEQIQVALEVAMKVDLDQEVAWLHNNATAEFARKYPQLNQVINNILAMEIEDE